MIIDTHVHVYSFPSFRDLSKHIRTMEDAIAFRTRYPDLYQCNNTEQPVDNTDDLVADMDRNGVDFALVQARAGYVSNDLVAAAARRHPKRMVALARVGHEQEAAGYHEDPGPAREAAPAELERCLGALGMKGVGETFVRALTDHVNPEKIARDLSGIMRVVEKHRVPIQFPTAWSQFPGGLFYGDPLWADEVAARHPAVPVILTKMGRIDKLGAERILFGTDWSATWRWLSVPATLHQIRMKVLDDARLTEAEREQILWKNAARLFRLESGARSAERAAA